MFTWFNGVWKKCKKALFSEEQPKEAQQPAKQTQQATQLSNTSEPCPTATATPLRDPVTEHEKPQMEDTAMRNAELTPDLSTLRFKVQRGQIVGVENTVRRYQEHRPVKVHSTPFEDRVVHVMQEELEVTPVPPLNLDLKQSMTPEPVK